MNQRLMIVLALLVISGFSAEATGADTDYNIYYCAADPALGEEMLEKQQGDGVDAHSLAVDPLFVDPEHGDFRLKPDSLALKLGFVPFDISKVGLRTDQKQRTASSRLTENDMENETPSFQ